MGRPRLQGRARRAGARRDGRRSSALPIDSSDERWRLIRSAFRKASDSEITEATSAIASRGLPLETIISILRIASVVQDRYLTYVVPGLQQDISLARRGAPDAIDPEGRAAIQRAFEGMCEIFDQSETVVLQTGDDRELLFEETDLPPGVKAIGVFEDDEGKTITEIWMEDGTVRRLEGATTEAAQLAAQRREAKPIIARISAGRIKFAAPGHRVTELPAPKTRYKDTPIEVDGYSGAVAAARGTLDESAGQRRASDQFWSDIQRLKHQAPAAAAEIEALAAKLPPPTPTVAASRPRDVFGRDGQAARWLASIRVPKSLRGRLLKLAQQSHPLY